MRALKCCFFLSIVISMTMFPVSAQNAGRGGHQSVGLVLSGGGAKGIAHIGVIQALEDNDIPIDYITGTSMGSIVGGLYACGYTPAEMMDLLTSQYFLSMSTGKADPAFSYFFGSKPVSPQMFSFSVGNKDAHRKGRFNPQSMISPTPMSFGFMQLFSAYTAQCHGDFNRLFVPFRCIASDLTQRKPLVHRSGDVGESIRSSMSFPLVFQPVEMDSLLLYDGGIYDNFPVSTMTGDFDPDIMIGVDVSASDAKIPNSFLDQITLLVTQPQSYEVPADKGIRLRVNLDEFGLLDFDRAKAIYEIGYQRGLEMMDSIKERVTARMPAESRRLRRAVFKANTPYLSFDSVIVTGGTPAQNKYIEHIFAPAKGSDTISIDRARLAFYQAISSDKIEDLYPKATVSNDSTGLFRLDLDAFVRNNIGIGVGGYISTSSNSYIYLRGDYSRLALNTLSSSVQAWLGPAYAAATVNGTVELESGIPSALSLDLTAIKHKYNEDSEPLSPIKYEYFGKLSWNMAAGRRGRIGVGLGGAHLFNSYFNIIAASTSNPKREHTRMNLLQAYVDFEFNTIDDINFPTSGFCHKGRIAALTGSHTWLQGDFTTRNYFDISRTFSFGVEAQASIGTRPLLNDYNATITFAPAYEPSSAYSNIFDPGLRANNYLAVKVVPIVKFTQSFSVRLSADCFLPVHRLIETGDQSVRKGKLFGSRVYFGEVDVVYTLPFGSVSAYGNYSSSLKQFNFGLGLGIFFHTPKFL